MEHRGPQDRHTDSTYTGDRTTGFASPAGGSVEGPIDLADALDLHRPSRYPVRVKGAAFHRRGILPDDVLVVDTSIGHADGRLVVAHAMGRVVLAELRFRTGAWWLHSGDGAHAPLKIAPEADVDVWGCVTGVVRTHV